MDFCAAGSIKDFIQGKLFITYSMTLISFLTTARGRPFSESVVANVLWQSLQGLKYLHSLHIIHRDLKAANILLTQDGVAKIGISFHFLISSRFRNLNSIGQLGRNIQVNDWNTLLEFVFFFF